MRSLPALPRAETTKDACVNLGRCTSPQCGPHWAIVYGSLIIIIINIITIIIITMIMMISFMANL